MTCHVLDTLSKATYIHAVLWAIPTGAVWGEVTCPGTQQHADCSGTQALPWSEDQHPTHWATASPNVTLNVLKWLPQNLICSVSAIYQSQFVLLFVVECWIYSISYRVLCHLSNIMEMDPSAKIQQKYRFMLWDNHVSRMTCSFVIPQRRQT